MNPSMTSIPFLSGGGFIAPQGIAVAPDPWVQGVSLGQSDSHMTSNATSSASGTSLASSSMDSEGTSTSESEAFSNSFSQGVSNSESESFSASQSEAHSLSHATSTAHMRGQSQTQGQSEALFPIYKDLPTSFHSKENIAYYTGEVLRSLPKGSAVIRAHGVTHRVAVPLSKIAKL